MSSIQTEDLLIRTLPTPNPYALKFVINSAFKEEGKATFNTAEECEDLPLVRDLFAIEGVRQAHLFQNTLTVTHSGEISNDEVSEAVSSVIRTRFSTHDPKFGEAAPKAKPRETRNDPTLEKIEEILDRTIRPGLQADGGDLEIVALEGNELQILYQGACGGCPSAMMGTLEAIQGILRYELGNSELVITPV